MIAILNRAHQAVLLELVSRLEEFDALARQDSDRADADHEDIIRDTIARLKGLFTRAAGLRPLATDFVEGVSNSNRRTVTRSLRAAVGIDVFISDQDLSDDVAQLVAKNVALITTIPERYFEEVERTMIEAFRRGQRPKIIAEEMSRRFEISKRRARFIARDQSESLNGQLTKRRQKALGITGYIWRTSKDARVRDMHRPLEGTSQEWDDPPVVSVDGRREHPGGDFN